MDQSKNKLIIVLVALFITLGCSAWALSSYQSKQDNTNQPSTSSIQDTPKAELGRTEISYRAKPGVSSLDQLKSEAKNVIIVENSEFGDYVDSIEGHKGSVNGYYWSFYINGEMAQVGAGTYIQKEGDLITWKYQNL